MEVEGIPNILSDLLVTPVPVDEPLADIYRGIADETLGPERARLQQRFLDMASKLITINEVMGER